MTSASHSATDLGRLIRGCTENESLESELEELFDGEMCQKPAVSAGHEVSMSVNYRKPKLPPELTDLIIAHLHDDVSALLACCLVHTSWIHGSRNQIFGSLSFHALSDLEEWAEHFSSASTSPAHHVQSLSVAGLWNMNTLWGERFNLDELHIPLLEHFRSFDQVRNLALTALNLRPMANPQVYFTHVQYSLRSLELYSPTVSSLGGLVRFISSFPYLEDLAITLTSRLVNNDEEPVYPSLQNSPPFRGNLQVLDSSNEEGVFLGKLVDLPNGVRFRSIELGCPKYEEYYQVQRLLIACGSSLEDLKLDYSFTSNPKYASQSLSLEYNTALRHLNLCVAASKPFSCHWMGDLLSTIRTPHPVSLTFKLKFEWYTVPLNLPRDVDWQSFDAIVDGVLDRSVVNRVEIYVFNGLVGWLHLVETALPRLNARGVLFASDRERWSPGSSRYAPVRAARKIVR